MPDAANIDTYKLPLMGHREKLPPLRGQDAAATYAVVWNVWEQPVEGLAYVVRLQPGNCARILGLITTTGFVYRANRPITQLPQERDAAVAISKVRENAGGGIYLANDAGKLCRIGDYTGSAENLLLEDPGELNMPTWTAKHASPYRTFMAMLFLHYAVVSPTDADRAISAATNNLVQALDMTFVTLPEPVEVFAGFQHMPLADAIVACVYAIDQKQDPSGIEAFAREEFSVIDLDRLRRLSAGSPMDLARISRNASFYINFDRSGMSEDEVRFILDVEMHLNRISRVLDTIGCGLSPLLSSPTLETCSALAMHDIMGVTSLVEPTLRRASEVNAWGRPGTVTCAPGGEWDVRTRMAQTCESMNLVARLEYDIDYNHNTRIISVEFIPPAAGGLPSRFYDEKTASWRNLSLAERKTVAHEFSARMALVIAAAGFSSSITIERCIVDQRAFAGSSRITRSFDRAAFLAELSTLAASVAEEPLLQGHVARELIRFEIDGRVLDNVQDPRKVAPRDDARELPRDLQDMLLAGCASELEVMELPDDPVLARVEELRAGMADDPATTCEQLMTIIEELQAGCVASELMASCPMSSQYCENHIARLVMGLTAENRSLRVNRVPDALFNAQYALANAYFNAQDYERALVEAQRLLDMAGTSSAAHFAVINALSRLERWDELVDVAKHGMMYTSQRDVIAYYFYRVAFAYWALGDQDTALACYRMVPRGEGVDASAREEMGRLMNQMGLVEPPSLAEAKAAVARAGIIPPPSDALMDFLADAAVRLTDEGFFFLASRCVHEMWRVMGRDELNVIMKSLT